MGHYQITRIITATVVHHNPHVGFSGHGPRPGVTQVATQKLWNIHYLFAKQISDLLTNSSHELQVKQIYQRFTQ